MKKIRVWKLIPLELSRLGKSFFPGIHESQKTILEKTTFYSKRFEEMCADCQGLGEGEDAFSLDEKGMGEEGQS